MRKFVLALAVILVAAVQLGGVSLDSRWDSDASSESALVSPQQQELHKTLALIHQNGPFPNTRDGITFENRERLLPNKPRGYYREYTVATPGLSHRGPRRVVTGGDPPEVFYYTEDHYRSFIRIEGH